MASTKISDIIVPEVFNKYVIERTAELTNFYLGGIVSTGADLDVLAQTGGKLINMPFWKDLTGADEVLSDSGSLTVNAIQTGQDVAVLHARGKAWGMNDLATALSGERDPMSVIGGMVADFWARSRQNTLISSLQGVMADNVANDSSDMSIDIAIEDGNNATASNKFSGDAFIDVQQTFGDALGNLSGIAMHSQVYSNLKKLDNISFEKESNGDIEIETYRGMKVIVNDTLPVVAGTTSGKKYTSYIFGNGAFASGQGSAPVPTETDRDSLAGEDVLITRDHFILHPRGVKFTNSSVAGSFPTNVECQNAGNWDRVYERKNVRIASIVTNG